MTKTPEQLAEEYADDRCGNWEECERDNEWEEAKRGFIAGHHAGYQAAKDEYKVAIDTYNDVAKQMLEEAIRIMSLKDQLADADKGMPKWISVKERLPPDGAKVLLIVFGNIHYGWIDQSPSDPTEYCLYFSNTYIDKGHHALTHWMPIPSKPKYMSDYVEYEAPKEAK